MAIVSTMIIDLVLSDFAVFVCFGRGSILREQVSPFSIFLQISGFSFEFGIKDKTRCISNTIDHFLIHQIILLQGKQLVMSMEIRKRIRRGEKYGSDDTTVRTGARSNRTWEIGSLLPQLWAEHRWEVEVLAWNYCRLSMILSNPVFESALKRSYRGLIIISVFSRRARNISALHINRKIILCSKTHLSLRINLCQELVYVQQW
jgi:hypothetical protein